jgi:hypothetical protein
MLVEMTARSGRQQKCPKRRNADRGKRKGD